MHWLQPSSSILVRQILLQYCLTALSLRLSLFELRRLLNKNYIVVLPHVTQLALLLRLCQTLTSLMLPHLELIPTLLLGWQQQQRLQVITWHMFIRKFSLKSNRSLLFYFFYSWLSSAQIQCITSDVFFLFCFFSPLLQAPQLFHHSTTASLGVCTQLIFSSSSLHLLPITRPISKHPVKGQGQGNHR